MTGTHIGQKHATLILQVLENRSQAYLREVRASLQEHGAVVSLSGLSRFFRRHGITRKKGRFTRPSRIVQTLWRRARRGSRANATLIRIASCSACP